MPPDESCSPPVAAPPGDKPPSAAPRDHLANERTMLAWARTAIAVFGLGFVVARFTVAQRESGTSSPVACATGVSMVACGLLLLGLGFVSYRRRGADSEHGRYEPSQAIPIALTAVVTLVGPLLGICLVTGRR